MRISFSAESAAAISAAAVSALMFSACPFSSVATVATTGMISLSSRLPRMRGLTFVTSPDGRR